MAYSLMIAPFDFANHKSIAARQFFDPYAFFELTPKRAKEYFLWFEQQISDRIALLWEYMKQDRPDSQPFDYSPESLLPLWEWYETKIKQVPMSKKEIEYKVSIKPKWMEENYEIYRRIAVPCSGYLHISGINGGEKLSQSPLGIFHKAKARVLCSQAGDIGTKSQSELFRSKPECVCLYDRIQQKTR